MPAAAWALAAPTGALAATAGAPVSTSTPSAVMPLAVSPISARDHGLPTLREAPALLLPYTMFLHVMVDLMPTGATMLAVRPPARVWGVSRNQPLNRGSRATYRSVTM